MAPRRGESSSQELVVTGGLKGANQPTQIRTFPILKKLNYQVWASRMRLHLEGLELWDTIESMNVIKKKDRQVMSILFTTISDEVTNESFFCVVKSQKCRSNKIYKNQTHKDKI